MSLTYNNSEVWLSTYLTDSVKHKLFVASANALKMCQHYPDQSISFLELHKITKRATPMMLSDYKCALQLYKTYNHCLPMNEWLHLNIDQVITSRQIRFQINRSSRTRIGRHSMCNRFYQLNGKIPLAWLGKSYNCYKVLCKKLFLSFNVVHWQIMDHQRVVLISIDIFGWQIFLECNVIYNEIYQLNVKIILNFFISTHSLYEKPAHLEKVAQKVKTIFSRKT